VTNEEKYSYPTITKLKRFQHCRGRRESWLVASRASGGRGLAVPSVS
jgi:hypothetical protein